MLHYENINLQENGKHQLYEWSWRCSETHQRKLQILNQLEVGLLW